MSILKQIFKDEERLELFMAWWDFCEIDEGVYHKHDTRFATKTLKVDDEIIKELPELSKYKGCTFEQEGTISYNYGWGSYDDIALYSYEEKQTKQYSDLKSLLSHLNAEEDEMALEYVDKYIKKTTKVETKVVL